MLVSGYNCDYQRDSSWHETASTCGLPSPETSYLTELGLLSLRQFLPILSSHWTISLRYYEKKKRGWILICGMFLSSSSIFFFKEKPN